MRVPETVLVSRLPAHEGEGLHLDEPACAAPAGEKSRRPAQVLGPEGEALAGDRDPAAVPEHIAFATAHPDPPRRLLEQGHRPGEPLRLPKCGSKAIPRLAQGSLVRADPELPLAVLEQH